MYKLYFTKDGSKLCRQVQETIQIYAKTFWFTQMT